MYEKFNVIEIVVNPALMFQNRFKERSVIMFQNRSITVYPGSKCTQVTKETKNEIDEDVEFLRMWKIRDNKPNFSTFVHNAMSIYTFCTNCIVHPYIL